MSLFISSYNHILRQDTFKIYNNIVGECNTYKHHTYRERSAASIFYEKLFQQGIAQSQMHIKPQIQAGCKLYFFRIKLEFGQFVLCSAPLTRYLQYSFFMFPIKTFQCQKDTMKRQLRSHYLRIFLLGLMLGVCYEVQHKQSHLFCLNSHTNKKIYSPETNFTTCNVAILIQRSLGYSGKKEKGRG